MARASTPPLSRSGRWLIGGTLIFSLIVLAWAFQDQTPSGGNGKARKPRRRETASISRRASSSPAPRLSVSPAHPPTVAEYGPLLQRNVFRPLVRIADRRGSSRELALRGVAARTGAEPRAASREPRAASAASNVPIVTNDWRGWRFSGIAQLDQRTYALMDQPGKKRSRFVKPGDRLEDAMVVRVGADEVTLREAGTPGDPGNGSSSGGSVVHVHRFDVMAELLRPSRSPASPPRPGTAPGAAPPPGPTPSRAPVATGTPPRDPGAPAQRVVGSSQSSVGPADQERPAVFNVDTFGVGENAPESRRSRRERRAREGYRFDASSEQPASEE